MKKFIYTLIFIVCIYSLNAQKKGIDPNGHNKFYYENGNISSEGMMKNGKPIGIWKTYYETGIIKSEGIRKNFLLDSIWVFYDKEGDIIKKISYRSDKKNGYYYTYKYNINKDTVKYGGVISKELYLNDIKQGISLYYTIDGYLKKTILYKNNKKNGISKEYAKDGRLITLVEYINDVLINKEFINRYNSEKLKHAIWKEFHSNDKIKTEANYINGKIHGLYKEYSASGNLEKVIKYEFGELLIDSIDSLEISDKLNKDIFKKLREEYHENGKIKYLGAFNDSIPVGLHKEYSENGEIINAKKYDDYGNLIGEGTYNQKGKKHGFWKYYYSIGEIKSEGKYINNRKSVKWTYYFKSGTIEQEGYFIKGKLDGEWKWYYENKKIEREENYELGKENGLFVEYSKNGAIITKGEYIEGEKEGFWFYNAGDHIEEGDYQLGLKENTWKHYYILQTEKSDNNEKGQLIFIGNYIQGNPNGKHKYYYDNGKMKHEGKYIMGSKEGNWYYYNYEGENFLIIKYRDDIEAKINGAKIKLQKE